MDVLSDILDTLRFRSCLYFSTDFRPPYGVAVPAFRNVARFHVVMSGVCWVRVGDEARAERLDAGDLVLVPHGNPHALMDAPGRKAVDVADVVRECGLDEAGCLAYGEGPAEERAHLVCGHFEFGDGEHPFLDTLPAKIVVRGHENAARTWLASILGLISKEVKSGRHGGDFVLKRLTEVLFIQTVRNWHERNEDSQLALLTAISDRHIGRSLSALHSKTAEPWTVEALAREAGLSRTAFAERFRKLVGQSPMHYVTAWRMQRARLLLKESDFSIDRIAVEVGYQSPASFARVFRKITGTSPGSVRRAANGIEAH